MALRIILVVKNIHIHGENASLQGQHMVLVVFSDSGNYIVVEFRQLRQQFPAVRSGQRLIQKIISADDPAVMVSFCKLLPDQKGTLPALRLRKHVGAVVDTVVAGQGRLAARRSVKIENRIYMIFFTPVQYLLQHGKAFLDPLDLRLLGQEKTGAHRQTDGVVTHIRHESDVLLREIAAVPFFRKFLRVSGSGQLPDRGLHRAAPLKSSGQREIVKASHLGKQGHASDHKAFRIHPASHAPASKDYSFAVFVYHFSAVSVKEALHAVS